MKAMQGDLNLRRNVQVSFGADDLDLLLDVNVPDADMPEHLVMVYVA